MIEETQTTIPEGETAPLPASADLPTAALTSTENAADAPVQTVGVAVPQGGRLVRPSDYEATLVRMVELENEIDPTGKMTNETRDVLVGLALEMDAIAKDTGADDSKASREALENIKALSIGASDEVCREVERLIAEATDAGEDLGVGSAPYEIATAIGELICPTPAEDMADAAVEAAECAAETVAEEAETLASEAVSEVKKVWNNSLQAWV